MSDRWDLIVVGGGPAGMSAALVTTLNGLRTVVCESRSVLGGQLLLADAPIPDLLGCYSEDGEKLAERFAKHMLSSRALVMKNTTVSSIRCLPNSVAVTLASGEVLIAKRILLATGLILRTLGVPGEELADSGSDPRKSLDAFDGKTGVIIGGGDEASSLAHDLACHGAKVTMLVRSRLRARPAFGDPVRAHPAVEIRQGAVVSALTSSGLHRFVALATGEEIEIDFCFVRIGAKPALPEITPQIDRRADGRVRVDHELRSNVPNLFAAGDLVRPPAERYIAAALADGVLVARKIETELIHR